MRQDALSFSDFFVVGGTLFPDSPSYVERPADRELFNLALAGEFCSVLCCRQMGKSSLMVRSAKRLTEAGIRTAIIDLLTFGSEVSAEQWYLGLIWDLGRKLRLSVDPESWWEERSSLGVVQRFTHFLHDVVLVEIEDTVVIFIDEIDSTMGLDFTDDFFLAIRSLYHARGTTPAYNRLSFVFLGIVAPNDLIKDRSRPRFNIDQKIELVEFSRDETKVFHQGLKQVYPELGDAVFDRIFYWTNGHPYLTQKLCSAVTEANHGYWTPQRVDELVEWLFLSEEARHDSNLMSVHDGISRSPQRRELLTVYRRVYEGKAVSEDKLSPTQMRLKLYGLVRVENGQLQVRNEIYRHVFDLDWIEANTPIDWSRRIAIWTLAFLLVVATLVALYIRK